jgi:8-oxo-dGTP diphosphatase
MARLMLVAACALIDGDGRVLLTKRPQGKAHAGLWEFPGGKLGEGETPEAAVVRELKEELLIDVAPSCLSPVGFASEPSGDVHLLMPLYVCRKWAGIARAAEGQELAWVRPKDFASFPMPPADRPLAAQLRDLL